MDIKLKRAIYGWGKFNIPELQREYTIINSKSSAVGTISEILEFLGKNGYKEVNLVIEDKDIIKRIKNVSCKGFD